MRTHDSLRNLRPADALFGHGTSLKSPLRHPITRECPVMDLGTPEPLQQGGANFATGGMTTLPRPKSSPQTPTMHRSPNRSSRTSSSDREGSPPTATEEGFNWQSAHTPTAAVSPASHLPDPGV
ncbi:hypothetical protein AAFF_G00148750 [Aldrovandia affinis]|uniref:Uncharacterized protein n=1 Tax=Aldrovandia affinis TaxID=143900 RepID=A0AAD7W8J5_9TELE|nr:hypothetical protein AAFF_G00148750 [Aldrovandia affinis]